MKSKIEQMKVLDEALSFLNERFWWEYNDRETNKQVIDQRYHLISCTTGALQDWSYDNGIVNIYFGHEARCFDDENKRFIYNGSKYFVIGASAPLEGQPSILTPIIDDTSKSINRFKNGSSSGSKYSHDTSGLNKFISEFPRNKKAIENFVSKEIGQKVAIKIDRQRTSRLSTTLIVSLL